MWDLEECILLPAPPSAVCFLAAVARAASLHLAFHRAVPALEPADCESKQTSPPLNCVCLWGCVLAMRKVMKAIFLHIISTRDDAQNH